MSTLKMIATVAYIIICIVSAHKELLPPNHNNIDT